MKNIFYYTFIVAIMLTLQACFPDPQQAQKEQVAAIYNDFNNKMAIHDENIKKSIQLNDSELARNEFQNIFNIKFEYENMTGYFTTTYEITKSIDLKIYHDFTKIKNIINIGNAPNLKMFKSKIHEKLETSLFDYDSAKIEISNNVKKGYFYIKNANRYTVIWCYMLNGKINAKNRFGAYTGYKNYMAYLVGDTVIISFPPEGRGTISEFQDWFKRYELIFLE